MLKKLHWPMVVGIAMAMVACSRAPHQEGSQVAGENDAVKAAAPATDEFTPTEKGETNEVRIELGTLRGCAMAVRVMVKAAEGTGYLFCQTADKVESISQARAACEALPGESFELMESNPGLPLFNMVDETLKDVFGKPLKLRYYEAASERDGVNIGWYELSADEKKQYAEMIPLLPKDADLDKIMIAASARDNGFGIAVPVLHGAEHKGKVPAVCVEKILP